MTAERREIRSESKIRRNPQVVARDLASGEGAVLLHLESAQYHGVNPIGLLIWELVDGERTVAEIIHALRVRVGSPPPHLETDVLGFLERIYERDLVVVE